MVTRILPVLFIAFILLGVQTEPAQAKNSFVIHQSFIGPKGKVFAGAISGDGKYIAMIDKRRTIRIWRYSNGRPLKAIKTYSHKPTVAIFHPTKHLLFTGGEDGKINIWDIAKGQKVKSLVGHNGAVEALAISKDGAYLASGGAGKMLLIWRLDKYKIFKKILEPSGGITSIDWHPNGKLIAWANGIGAVKVWDTNRGTLISSHKLHTKKVSEVHFHPSGSHIVSSGFDHKVVFWDFRRKKVSKNIEVHQGPITGFGFDPKGITMVTCSLDKSIKVWDLRRDKVRSHLKLVDKPVLGCSFGNNAKTIIGVFESNYLRGWNLADNGHLSTLKGHVKSISSLDFSSSGKYLISLSNDGDIRLWNLAKMKLIRAYKKQSKDIPQCVRFSPNNRQFATCGSNSIITIRSVASGKVVAKLVNGHKGKINSLDYNPVEPKLISAGADKKIIIWNLKSRRILYQKKVHRGQINRVRYSKNGLYYGTGSADKTAKVFKSSNNRQLFNFKNAKRGIRSIDFSSSNGLFATASDDTRIRLYDLTRGTLIHTMRGHEFIISGIGFSPSGLAIVSGSRDKTVKLWDTRGGKFIRTLTGEDDQITALAVSQNGKTLVAGGLRGDINVIHLPQNIFGQRIVLRKGSTGIPKKQINSQKINLEERGQLDQVQPEKKEFSAKDIMEEQASMENDSVFEPPQTYVDLDLNALKQNLNNILAAHNTCKNVAQLENIALKVLAKRADDQAAFYGLLQVYLLKHDVQMVFLMAKLGAKAHFQVQDYNFIDPVKVTRFFNVWNNQVFNLSVVKGATLKLELIDCDNNVQSAQMPKNLLFYEIPLEVLEKMISGKLKIDFQSFTGLSESPELFQARLFSLIAAIDQGKTDIQLKTLQKYSTKGQQAGFGTLRLDLTHIDQYSDQSRIEFQLKHSQLNWLSYLSDTDRTKTLMLPAGEYYLRVNHKLKRAFVVRKNQQISDQINR